MGPSASGQHEEENVRTFVERCKWIILAIARAHASGIRLHSDAAAHNFA